MRYPLHFAEGYAGAIEGRRLILMLGEGSETLFIKDLIRRVHEELLESQREREARGENAIFEVSSLVVEVNFVAVQSKERTAGIDFKIVTAGGTGHYEEQQIHKVTLSLTAIDDLASSDLELPDTSARFRPREE